MDPNNIREARNIFDCMAIAFEMIRGSENRNIQNIRDRYQPVKFQEIFSIIRGYASDPGSFASQFRVLQAEIMTFLKGKQDLECAAYALIEAIDQFGSMKATDCNVHFQSLVSYPSLTECMTQTIILPRSKDSFMNQMNANIRDFEKSLGYKRGGFRERLLYDPSSINLKLKNFFIYDSTLLSKKVNFVEVDPESINDCGKQMFEKIRFGIFPLLNEDKENIFDFVFNPETFSIERMNASYEEIVLRNCLSAIDLSSREGIDFVIFPEMLLTDSIAAEIIDHIKTSSTSDCPKLIFLGSIWQNRMNRCLVISNLGEVIFEQHKQSTYQFNNHSENLSFENITMNILEYPQIGRIFTLICSDIRDEITLSMVERFGGDLIILPAFTPSLDLKTKSEDLAKSYLCATVMGNSSSALALDREYWTDYDSRVGFISIPGKVETSNSCKTEYYSMDENYRRSDLGSLGWLVTIYPGDIIQDSTNTICAKMTINALTGSSNETIIRER